MKKRIFITLVFTLIATVTSSYLTSLASEKITLNDVLNDERYAGLTVIASDIQTDDETGNVSFKNSGTYDGIADTNTYVVDSSTVFGTNEPEGFPTFEDFKAGNIKYIRVIIDADKIFHSNNKVQNETIPVVGVWGVFDKIIGAEDKNSNLLNEENIRRPKAKNYSEETEFERLKSYKIMKGDQNGNLNLELPVTRAEMAQFAANAKNLQSIKAENIPAEGFTDVGENHWANDAICVLKSQGYIDGNGDGTFAPDDKVTYEQAIKMLVGILGYTPLAEEAGGYPDGYIKTAELIGLTENISFERSDYALRKDIAVMLDTALDIPIAEQFVFGSEAEYRILNGENGTDLVTLKNELEPTD